MRQQQTFLCAKIHGRTYTCLSLASLFDCMLFLYFLALAYKGVDYDYKGVHLVKGEQVQVHNVEWFIETNAIPNLRLSSFLFSFFFVRDAHS